MVCLLGRRFTTGRHDTKAVQQPVKINATTLVARNRSEGYGRRVTDDALIRFTALELSRDDLHVLMARSNGPALARAVCHLGVLAVTGTLSLEASRDGVGAAAADGPRVRARLRLLRVSRGSASDGISHPLAQRGARHGGRLPDLLAIPELPGVPLGASSAHAGSRPGPRALLPEACLRSRPTSSS